MDRIKVGVIGAAGQIGSVLVLRLLECSNIETIAVCRNNISAGLIYFNAPNSDIRVGSITERDSAKHLIGDCDIIINCALASISGAPKQSRAMNEAMINNFCSIEKVKSIIHLSSLSVYGGFIDSKTSQHNRFDKPRPDSDYGRSKLYIEKYAKSKFVSKNLNYYILRLGHVYGAHTDRSRQIIELALDPYFRLPFNGALPSNSIHVEYLASIIIALLSKEVPSGTYNVADKNLIWRDVFDWHTHILGFSPVEGMSIEQSDYLRAMYYLRSVSKDITSWVRTLPILSLVRYPIIFDKLYRFLYFMPPTTTKHLAIKYKRRDIKRQIASVSKDYNVIISPVYFSDAMPGPYLQVLSKPKLNGPSEEELSVELKKWYLRFSQPRWLPNSVIEESK